jgi:hypothetical protein
MTKEAAVRSILRRRALTKAADEYSDILNGYRNAHRGWTRAGVGIAVNDNLRKSGYPPASSRTAPAVQPRPAPAARQAPAAPAAQPAQPLAQAPAARPAPGGALAWIRSKLGR